MTCFLFYCTAFTHGIHLTFFFLEGVTWANLTHWLTLQERAGKWQKQKDYNFSPIYCLLFPFTSLTKIGNITMTPRIFGLLIGVGLEKKVALAWKCRSVNDWRMSVGVAMFSLSPLDFLSAAQSCCYCVSRHFLHRATVFKASDYRRERRHKMR